MDIWLFPIEPQYACCILSGVKKYELRGFSKDHRLGVKEGSIIVIYVISPIKAILGEFIAGKPIEGTPDKVWCMVGKLEYGITPESHQYIMNHECAVAIPVIDPRCYAKPVTLDEIRERTGKKRWTLPGPIPVKPRGELFKIIMEARREYRDCQDVKECRNQERVRTRGKRVA